MATDSGDLGESSDRLMRELHGGVQEAIELLRGTDLEDAVARMQRVEEDLRRMEETMQRIDRRVDEREAEHGRLEERLDGAMTRLERAEDGVAEGSRGPPTWGFYAALVAAFATILAAMFGLFGQGLQILQGIIGS